MEYAYAEIVIFLGSKGKALPNHLAHRLGEFVAVLSPDHYYFVENVHPARRQSLLKKGVERLVKYDPVGDSCEIVWPEDLM